MRVSRRAAGPVVLNFDVPRFTLSEFYANSQDDGRPSS